MTVAIIAIAGSAVSLFIYRELFEHCLLRFVSIVDPNFLVEELQFQEVAVLTGYFRASLFQGFFQTTSFGFTIDFPKDPG